MTISLDQLNEMADIVRLYGSDPAGPWGKYNGQHMDLPDWFNRSLNPSSEAYRVQQMRLWKEVCGSADDYDPGRDEQAEEVRDVDPVRFPAFYSRRDAAAINSAGDHVVAMGHLLKRCRISPGDWALEYGAGFGQTALTLARLGVNVDTVDINPMFNVAVNTQALHFDVPLRAFEGEFGLNPRGDARYDLILFYEAFHHCTDFPGFIDRLRDLLSPQGQILMAGEPIVTDSPDVPYPWGIRMNAETLAVMRWRRWFELGFQEAHLARTFIEHGFVWTKHPCQITHYGDVHEFRLRPARIKLSDYAFLDYEVPGWHAPEGDGRWTRERADLPIDATGGHNTVALHLVNSHAVPITVEIVAGDGHEVCLFEPGEARVVHIATRPGTGAITFMCQPVSPASYGVADARELGVFLRSFDYI